MQTYPNYWMTNKTHKHVAQFLLAIAATMASHSIQAKTVKVEIVTEIRDISLMSFQVGEKSRQTITLNLNNKTHDTSFKTGVTNIGVDLPSLRDNFIVENIKYDDNTVEFTAAGSTGTFVSFFGDIDYKFNLKLDNKTQDITLSGCHNEYPSYYILVDGSRIYDRVQSGAVLTGALMGNCDIDIDPKQKKH